VDNFAHYNKFLVAGHIHSVTLYFDFHSSEHTGIKAAVKKVKGLILTKRKLILLNMMAAVACII
jgi:hypothetical protein